MKGRCALASNRIHSGRFASADRVVSAIAKYYSYISVAAVLVMAVLATCDVIASKFFGSAIPITNDIVKYFMVSTCFCLLGTVQLGGGLMSVDLFTRKYGPGLRKIFGVISGVLGAVVFSFAGWQTTDLLLRHFRNREMSAASTYAFPLWPLTLLCALSIFLLAFSFVWTTLRLFLLPERSAAEEAGGTAPKEERGNGHV